MKCDRRQFLTTLGLSLLGTQLPSMAKSIPLSDSAPFLKPPALTVGDTIGLINPAGEIQPEDITEIEAFLLDNGFKIKRGNHIFDQYGYLAGIDEHRAQDVNQMFAEPEVKALLCLRGGWGCNRILPLLDYDLIAQNPKIIMGYSDITSLLLAIYAQTGLITFHGAVGISTWNPFTVSYIDRILIRQEALTLHNPPQTPTQTLTSGIARGRLLGGNLSVLTSMIGSDYLPSWENAILFVEEIGEDIYRIDRMLTQLKLAGILEQLSGFIFAQCRNCGDPEEPAPTLTLEQVLRDHLQPLQIPTWYGSMIGHIKDKFTIPVGLPVEINSDRGTIKMLESAVSSS